MRRCGCVLSGLWTVSRRLDAAYICSVSTFLGVLGGAMIATSLQSRLHVQFAIDMTLFLTLSLVAEP